MKHINYKKDTCRVKEIPVGECFIYCCDLFMVVETTEDNIGDDIICVNLSNGTFPSTSYINFETPVIPANINIDVL